MHAGHLASYLFRHSICCINSLTAGHFKIFDLYAPCFATYWIHYLGIGALLLATVLATLHLV